MGAEDPLCDKEVQCQDDGQQSVRRVEVPSRSCFADEVAIDSRG